MPPSKIEWCTDHFEPVGGCRRKSAGCQHCYAERMVAQMAGVAPSRYRPNQRYAGLTVLKSGEPHFTGSVALWPDKLVEPLSWRKPRTVFVCSQSDLFYEERPFEHIAAVYAVMAATPHIRYLVLTKRPERRREFFAWLHTQADRHPWLDAAERLASALSWDMDTGQSRVQWGKWLPTHKVYWPLPNVGEGVSVEDQETADERIPVLLDTPAAMRFVSYEPALGPVQFGAKQLGQGDTCPDCGPVSRVDEDGCCLGCGEDAMWYGLDWLIAGAESGPGARPAPLDWFRSVRDQCAPTGVPFFLKQADICPMCSGAGGQDPCNCRPVTYTTDSPIPGPRVAFAGEWSGQTGKVRKGCPALDGVVHDARPAWLTGGAQ